jgi:dihydroflavonol-4-reductase
MIAVTGANGLLGSFIIRQLLEENKPFVALSRPGSDLSLLSDISFPIHWRTADVTDPVALEEAFRDVTQVIHTAAIVSFNPAHEERIMNVNVNGTRNVVDACLSQKNIKRLVHISSVAALGRDGVQQSLIDESNKWSESSLNSAYAKSKYLAELEIFRGQEEGLSTVMVNPSVILAPADWTRSSAQLFKYIWDERKFYIHGHLNYVDARDVAHATCQLMESDLQSERYILNAGSIPFIDFFRSVATRFDKKAPSVKLNKSLLKVAAVAEVLRSKITRSEPLITRETARLAGTKFSYSSQKIENTLNFQFKTIDSTLDWCCAHYLNFISKK